MTRLPARWAVTAAVAAPYFASLALPAVTGSIDAPNSTALGVQALAMGFVANPIVWLANVLLVAGLAQLHTGRLKGAAVLGAVAVGCAALPLVWSLGLDLEIGYYVWLSSMAIFLVGALAVLTIIGRVPA